MYLEFKEVVFSQFSLTWNLHPRVVAVHQVLMQKHNLKNRCFSCNCSKKRLSCSVHYKCEGICESSQQTLQNVDIRLHSRLISRRFYSVEGVLRWF
jgi:hypothetical protein